MVKEVSIAEMTHPDLEMRVLMMRSAHAGKVLVVYEDAYEHLTVQEIDGQKELGDILTEDLGLSVPDAEALLGVPRSDKSGLH